MSKKTIRQIELNRNCVRRLKMTGNLRLAFIVAVICLSVSFSAEAQQSSESWNDSFAKQADLVWYDVENESLRPIELDDPKSAASQDRNKVPVEQPSANSQQRTSTANTTAPSDSQGMHGLAWVLLAFVLLIVTGLLIWAFLNAENRHSAAGDDDEKRAEIGATAEQLQALPFVADRPAGDWLSAAYDEKTKGNYEKAIMYLYSHLLLTLDRKELIQLARGKTNRRYLSELKQQTELHEPFRSIMNLFERSFFGHQQINIKQIENCFEQWEFVQQAIANSVANRHMDLATAIPSVE